MKQFGCKNVFEFLLVASNCNLAVNKFSFALRSEEKCTPITFKHNNVWKHAPVQRARLENTGRKLPIPIDLGLPLASEVQMLGVHRHLESVISS